MRWVWEVPRRQVPGDAAIIKLAPPCLNPSKIHVGEGKTEVGRGKGTLCEGPQLQLAVLIYNMSFLGKFPTPAPNEERFDNRVLMVAPCPCQSLPATVQTPLLSALPGGGRASQII